MSSGVTYLSPKALVPIFDKLNFPDIGSNSQSLELIQKQISNITITANSLNSQLNNIGTNTRYAISYTLSQGVPYTITGPTLVLGAIYLVTFNFQFYQTDGTIQLGCVFCSNNQTGNYNSLVVANLTNPSPTIYSATLNATIGFICTNTTLTFTIEYIASGSASVSSSGGSYYSVMRIK